MLISVSSLWVLNTVSTKALTKNAEQNLVSKLANTSDALDSYFSFIDTQIKNKASDPNWIAASHSFVKAFESYSQQRAPLSSKSSQDLESYYQDDFALLYQEKNNTPLQDSTQLYSSLDSNAKALQHDFIVSSDFEIGEKDGLSHLANNTDYSKVHSSFHPRARQFLKDFAYYDVFLLDPHTGNVVYSVYKELDYATNLETGPYANSGIGEVFQKAKQSTQAGDVFYSAFMPYVPSYNAMAGFISTPIFDQGKQIAILVFQIPMNRLNTVLTRNQHWLQQGFGYSGETYLVSEHKKLITESRFFLEDKDGYLSAIKTQQPKVASQIKAANTSVGLQSVDSTSVNAALAEKSGFSVVSDYRGVTVFSAYKPFKRGIHTFALIAEIDEAEALMLAKEIQSSLLTAVCIVAVIVLLIASVVGIFVANKVNKPLAVVAEVCDDLASGNGDLSIRMKKCGIGEIDHLLGSFNIFIEQVHNIIATLRDDAHALASASEELSAITNETRTNVVEQTQQTQMVSKSIDELSSSISDISQTVTTNLEQSQAANEKLNANLGKTEVATQKIRHLVTLIRDSRDTISELSQKVVQVTKLLEDINGIADQTNLLALNAAIEAARAGDAGRGFSVVADEVRTLATRSQQSTEEISQIIGGMTSASDQSVDAMENAVIAADQGIALVDTVTQALNDLAQALSENQQLATLVSQASVTQSQTSTQVGNSVHNIQKIALEAENGAKQSNEAAAELSRIAAKSMEIVQRFKLSK